MNTSIPIVESATFTAPAAQVNAAGTPTKYTTGRVCKGLILYIDITNIHSGTPSITVTIKGYDPVSQKTRTILASAALGSVATTVLKVYPGLTAAANAVVSDIMDPTFEVTVSHADGQSIDYSIGANLVL